jgi:hypothetical protein
VFVRYPPGRIRYEGDRPGALLGIRAPASRFRLIDLPLGTPTTLARTGRGTWALYPLGAEVVVVHPGGAVSGPPLEVAAEVARLAAHDRQGELDRQAAQAIRNLLLGDGADRTRSRRLGHRTWSLPARAYWISGPYNHRERPAAQPVGRSGRRHGTDHVVGGRATGATSPAGTQPAAGHPGSPARARQPSGPTRSPRHRPAADRQRRPRRRDESHGHVQQLSA